MAQSKEQSAPQNPPEKNSSVPLSTNEKKGFAQKIKGFFSKKKEEEVEDSGKVQISKAEIDQARKKLEAELGQKLAQIRASKPGQLPPLEQMDNGKGGQPPPVSGNRYLPTVKGTQLQQILDSLEKKDYDSTIRKISAVNFGSLKEFIDSLISELAGFLEDYYNDLSYKLSQLRKEGVEADDIGYRIMQVPLKINLFKSTGFKKDFDKAKSMLDNLKVPIEAVAKEMEARKQRAKAAEEAAQRAQEQAQKNPPVQKTVVPATKPQMPSAPGVAKPVQPAQKVNLKPVPKTPVKSVTPQRKPALKKKTPVRKTTKKR